MKVDPEHIRVLAEALEDPNPIHLDPDAVSRLGLGDRVINQGPANCAYVVNKLRETFPGGRITAFDVRLMANVFGGDEVHAGTRITERTATHAHCHVWLDRTDGTRVVEGTATVAL
jgi:3-hydroxybutyryl-CoA dehydratase